jgi:hypothetical protein
MNALPKKVCPKAARTAKGRDNQSLESPTLSNLTYPESKPLRKRKPRLFDFDGQQIRLTGKTALTLEALIRAGQKGVTALEMSSWALRLAAYIHTLRTVYGMAIETLHETHNELGDWHGRYVLQSRVLIMGTANVG